MLRPIKKLNYYYKYHSKKIIKKHKKIKLLFIDITVNKYWCENKTKIKKNIKKI